MPNQMLIKLTENQVIDYVENYLVNRLHFDRDLIETSYTHQRGIDIKATLPDGQARLYVEAKGEKSSDPDSPKSKRGESFDTGQKQTHLGMALLWACSALTKPPESDVHHYQVGIALPADKQDKDLVYNIEGALKSLGIVVFLVGSDGQVSIKGSPLRRP